MTKPLLTSNFAHLQEHDAQLLRLGMLTERYFPEDPNTSLLKLRQLTELLAQLVATQVGLYQSPEEPQYDLLRRLQARGRRLRPARPHLQRRTPASTEHLQRIVLGSSGLATRRTKVTYEHYHSRHRR